jgi:hypothetical protein
MILSPAAPAETEATSNTAVQPASRIVVLD